MLKIDRTFVNDLPANADAGALVAAVIQLAHNLGIEPIAEGIETEDQRRFLVDRACGLGQGFLFSRPVPLDQIEAMRRSSRPGLETFAAETQRAGRLKERSVRSGSTSRSGPCP